jgi:hypothetical protein
MRPIIDSIFNEDHNEDLFYNDPVSLPYLSCEKTNSMLQYQKYLIKDSDQFDPDFF